MPPFAGPRAMECCTRNPVKTSSLPLSMETGMWTMSSRLGYCSTFHRPSSRLSFWAAKLKRADCASQGLISCSRETVFIGSPIMTTMPSGREGGWSHQANLQILVSWRRVSKQRMWPGRNRRLYLGRMKLEHLASANLGSSLLISVVPEQSPGLIASDLLDLLRAMSRVPVSPGGCIVRQRLVSYFSQRLENPHTRGGIKRWIIGEFKQSRHGLHALHASQHAGFGHAATGALADLH